MMETKTGDRLLLLMSFLFAGNLRRILRSIVTAFFIQIKQQ